MLPGKTGVQYHSFSESSGGPPSNTLKKHPFATFVILAFMLSWYPWVLHLTGLVPRASGMNPLGVIAAAFISAAWLGGAAGAKELLKRLLRFRVHPGWYALALALPIMVGIAALSISLLSGARLNEPLRLHPLALLQSFVFMFFFVGVGEETGWRGFAVPELIKRYTWRLVALQVGIVWAIWHAPFWGTEIAWPQLPAFLISVLAASVVSTFLFLRTRYSVPLVCAFHGMVDACSVAFFPLFKGGSLTILWWVDSLLWCAIAGFLLLRYGREPYAGTANVAPAGALS